MIKAIIFDCFGVIRLDSIYPAYRALGGNPEQDATFIWDNVNAVSAGMLESASPSIAEKLGVSQEEWMRTSQELSGRDQRVLDYILELRKSYKTALLSNIGKGGLERWFEPGELDRYFDVAVASGDVGVAKPEAQVYVITAQKLSERVEDCVFIDDREDYCEGARGVGMRAVWYKDFEQMKRDIQLILHNVHN